MADEESPKIIIDEDWKARVEREKEEASKAEASGGEPESPATGPGAAAPTGFEALVSYLASHVMGALGMFAPSDAEEVPVNLEMARFLIDSLTVLRGKTKGNLTPQEEGRLTEIIAELQRGFVACSQAVHETQLRGAGLNRPDIARP